jgi:rhamnose utilization protein RhaD (predicted bifunctional aldolase and dehydrogenase)
MVQAGGGNASVKCFDGAMLIKASGIGLSEVEYNKGISVVVNGVALPGEKPSMEVGMHALLDTWVLHTHPLVVGIVVCRFGWQDILKRVFPEALLIEYCSPGDELACVLQQKKNELGGGVIFLQNHGLIVYGQSADLVWQVTEDVLAKLEVFLGVNFGRYKQTTHISSLVRNQVPSFTGAAYLSEDGVLKSIFKTHRHLFEIKPCCPDFFIYGGYEVVNITAETGLVSASRLIEQYSLKYNTYPRVVMYGNDVFFLANSVRKAQEAEAAFKAQLLIALHGKNHIQSLTFEKLEFLARMSSEQYRQNG